MAEDIPFLVFLFSGVTTLLTPNSTIKEELNDWLFKCRYNSVVRCLYPPYWFLNKQPMIDEWSTCIVVTFCNIPLTIGCCSYLSQTAYDLLFMSLWPKITTTKTKFKKTTTKKATGDWLMATTRITQPKRPSHVPAMLTPRAPMQFVLRFACSMRSCKAQTH